MKKILLNSTFGFLIICITALISCNHSTAPLGIQTSNGFDVPTQTWTPSYTPTITGTPTITPIASPIIFNVTVNYGGVKTGVSYNIVDQAGVTVATTTNTVPYSYAAYDFGTYTINILPNNPYALSSQTVLVTGPGLVTVPFSSSGWSLSTNPSSLIYQSSSGYQTPVTVLYSASGNLNVPAVITAGGLASAFSVSPSSLTLQPNTSGPLTITKGACYVQNTSLNFSASDNQGGSLYSTSAIAFNKGFTVNVNLSWNSANNGTVVSGCGGGCVYTTTWTDTLQLSDGGLGCSYSVNFDGSSYTLSNGQSATSNPSAICTFSGCTNYDPNSPPTWSVTLPNGSAITYPSTSGSY